MKLYTNVKQHDSARTVTLNCVNGPLKLKIDFAIWSCLLYYSKTVQGTFKQILTNIRRHAEHKQHNSCIYTFLSYAPLIFVSSFRQNRVRSVTLKPFKVSS